MTTKSTNKLKNLYDYLKPGQPVRYESLAELGISPDLAVYYAKSGWLKRLANGVYVKPGHELDLKSSIKLLERNIEGLHVGGKTALQWRGIKHYIYFKNITQMYGWNTSKLPEWFASEFTCDYHRKRIFTEEPERLLYTSDFGGTLGGPKTSEPERAILEMLDEVGVRQGLTEAREIMEGALNLRSDVVMELLFKCTSVKTVRLFISLASELNLPVYNEIKTERFPTGSSSNWVGHYKNFRLVLKP